MLSQEKIFLRYKDNKITQQQLERKYKEYLKWHHKYSHVDDEYGVNLLEKAYTLSEYKTELLIEIRNQTEDNKKRIKEGKEPFSIRNVNQNIASHQRHVVWERLSDTTETTAPFGEIKEVTKKHGQGAMFRRFKKLVDGLNSDPTSKKYQEAQALLDTLIENPQLMTTMKYELGTTMFDSYLDQYMGSDDLHQNWVDAIERWAISNSTTGEYTKEAGRRARELFESTVY